MLAVARAMLRRPSSLMLDEPTLGLPPRWLATLRRPAQIKPAGATFLLSSQNAKLA